MDLTLKTRLPNEDPEWVRMLRYVHWEVARLELLAPIRRAGHVVTVHAHTEAIFAMTVRDPFGSEWLIKEEIQEPEWWMPLKRSRGDELVDRLARGVLAKWEERVAATRNRPGY